MTTEQVCRIQRALRELGYDVPPAHATWDQALTMIADALDDIELWGCGAEIEPLSPTFDQEAEWADWRKLMRHVLMTTEEPYGSTQKTEVTLADAFERADRALCQQVALNRQLMSQIAALKKHLKDTSAERSWAGVAATREDQCYDY